MNQETEMCKEIFFLTKTISCCGRCYIFFECVFDFLNLYNSFHSRKKNILSKFQKNIMIFFLQFAEISFFNTGILNLELC